MKQRRAQIRQAIDRLFEKEAKERHEEIRFFLQHLHARYIESYKDWRKQVISLAAVWLGAYAVSEGIVSGGSLASFKLNKLELIVLIAPIVLGVISYRLYATGNAQSLYRTALSRCYKHLLPTAHDLRLEFMLVPAGLLDLENFLAPSKPGMAKVTSSVVDFLVTLFLLLGPFASIVHASYLAWNLHEFPTSLVALSTLAGLALYFRACIVMVADYEMPETKEAISGEAKVEEEKGTVANSSNPLGRADV